MKIEDKMMTNKNLKSIAVNAIFAQILNTYPVQEAPGENGKFSFEKGYKMFDEREISIMFKE